MAKKLNEKTTKAAKTLRKRPLATPPTSPPPPPATSPRC